MKTKYTKEFIDQVLQEATKKSVAEVAKHFNIHPPMVYKWRKQSGIVTPPVQAAKQVPTYTKHAEYWHCLAQWRVKALAYLADLEDHGEPKPNLTLTELAKRLLKQHDEKIKESRAAQNPPAVQNIPETSTDNESS